MYRCHRPATWLTWFALTGLGLGLAVGCNPALLGNINGTSIAGLDAPNGYIIILLMNQTNSNVVANVQVTKQNGATHVWTMSAGPLGFLNLAQDCDTASIQFLDFGFASTGGLTIVPGNLGVLTVGQSINCGNVLAVTASGTPPTFAVQVY